MFRFTRNAAAAAIAMGLFATTVHATIAQPFEGVVLVPPVASVQPQFKRARIVPFEMPAPTGSIIIITRENALYYVLGNGRAAKFKVATARKGFEWTGIHQVSSKTVWPDWRPPEEMRKRHPELPVYMEGGPANPLGARAIYLGSSIYRIHGTNEPKSIGKAASSGCIRMLNEDVKELYRNVRLGATVIVI
jgi:lipoprotein-anchoring transpeptidase ErfK/SrfK